MAASIKHLCTQCCDGGVSKKAVIWCKECEVFFCGDCEKLHRKSKRVKGHNLISVQDYQKLPTLIKEMSSMCRDHNKRFELYCSVHSCPCCVKCKTDKHQKCSDMKPLSEILKKVKSSASVQLFENDLKDVKEDLFEAIRLLKTKILTNNFQKTKAVEKVRNMRKSINDYLNGLEQTLLNDLEINYSKLKSNMNIFIQQMEQRASQLDQMQRDFNNLINNSTELQTYVGLREIEEKTSEAAKYIADLESRNIFNEEILKVNISSEIESILQHVKSFGDIIVTTTSSKLRVKTGRKHQAQYLVPSSCKIEDIKPFFIERLTIPEDVTTLNIWACVVLHDGKLVMFDYNKARILLFSNDGIFVREVVSFTETLLDACLVGNNTVAVALGSANQTALVDIENNTIIRTVNLSHQCDAVGSDGEAMVVSGIEKSSVVNLNDMSFTILEGVGAYHIALSNGHIYGTINNENKIYCYKITGEPLWVFKHEEIQSPQGITLDQHGFVYIASRGNNSIVVVSPDGKTSKQLLSEADGIQNPYVININRELGLMIDSIEIRKNSDSAVVYNI